MVEQVSKLKAFPVKVPFTQEALTDLNTRRKTEKGTMLSMETRTRTEEYYLINTNWIKAWTDFINGGAIPGPIRNRLLYDKLTTVAKEHLSIGKDYRALNRKQWEYLLQIYGADVEITCSDPQNPIIQSKILNSYFKKVNRRTLSNIISANERSEISLKDKPIPNLTDILDIPPQIQDLNTPKRNTSFNIDRIREIKKKFVANYEQSYSILNKSNSSGFNSLKIQQRIMQSVSLQSQDIKVSNSSNLQPAEIQHNMKRISLQSQDINVSNSSNLQPAEIQHSMKRIFIPSQDIKESNSSLEIHQGSIQNISTHSQDPKEEAKYQDSIITTSSTDTSSKMTKTGLVGLINRGNFCYLNASLQCLFCLNSLTDYLIKEIFQDQKAAPYCAALSCIATQIFNKDSSIADPNALGRLCSAYFQASKQHDMPEFIRYLLEKIDSELGEGNNITRCFTGNITSLLLCEECRFTSIKKEKFYDLQLSLAKTLPKSFGHFTSPEKLSGDFKCPKCNHRGSIIKTINLTDCPKYLIIQLKRFIHSPYPRKLSQYCRFRRKMNLSKYIGQNVEYDLCSVGVHKGDYSSGHYVSYGKRDKSWYCFNDVSVKK